MDAKDLKRQKVPTRVGKESFPNKIYANLMRKRSWDLLSKTNGNSEGVLSIILVFPVSDEGGTAIQGQL